MPVHTHTCASSSSVVWIAVLLPLLLRIHCIQPLPILLHKAPTMVIMRMRIGRGASLLLDHTLPAVAALGEPGGLEAANFRRSACLFHLATRLATDIAKLQSTQIPKLKAVSQGFPKINHARRALFKICGPCTHEGWDSRRVVIVVGKIMKVSILLLILIVGVTRVTIPILHL